MNFAVYKTITKKRIGYEIPIEEPQEDASAILYQNIPVGVSSHGSPFMNRIMSDILSSGQFQIDLLTILYVIPKEYFNVSIGRYGVVKRSINIYPDQTLVRRLQLKVINIPVRVQNDKHSIVFSGVILPPGVETESFGRSFIIQQEIAYDHKKTMSWKFVPGASRIILQYNPDDLDITETRHQFYDSVMTYVEQNKRTTMEIEAALAIEDLQTREDLPTKRIRI